MGLTSDEVAERIAAGKVNANADVRTRSVARIFRDNLCTLFNFVNLVLAVAIFFTGAYSNLLFMAIIVANIVIGIVQEVRAKRVVDRLSVVTQTRAHVLRDGRRRDVPLDGIVLDDVVMLGRGDQVPADCAVVDGSCSANESLLTGEADPIPKRAGDELLSGSFVVSGSCAARVTAVGADNYANRISNEAKAHKKVASEIMQSLDAIVKYVSITLLPLGALLFGKEMLLSPHGDVNSAILHTSAALIGMIPQGLILLTSAVLAVSVFRLAQHRVLVQQIYCVETLARVDVVCLDKTGTITTGDMDVEEVVPLDGATYDEAFEALLALVAASEARANETFGAVSAYVEGRAGASGAQLFSAADARIIPFSSERKYSGVCYGSSAGNYALGAVEFVMRGSARRAEVQQAAERLCGSRRVLVVARVDDFDEDDAIIGDVEPLGLVFVRDRIRPAARDTLGYFREQGVRVNVVSGDSVETVGKVADAAGLVGADKRADMSEVAEGEDFSRAVSDCRVFGRVSPAQKKQIVQELQRQGHTVAMVGDGVNDVLALHASDCPVAMGSGSDAARSIAQVVLLDDDFASLPAVVAEGRRAINNLQRSAVLYLTKTMYSIAFAVLFVFLVAYDFPFAPVQLTVLSFFVIGLPSFVLALEPNAARNRGRFLRNVATRSLPGALAIVIAVVALIVLGVALGATQAQFQTMCVLASAAVGLNVVVRQSQPFNAINVVLDIACIGGLSVCVAAFGSFLMLEPLPADQAVGLVCVLAVVMAAFNLAYSEVVKRQKAYLDAVEEAQRASRQL